MAAAAAAALETAARHWRRGRAALQ